MWPVKKWWNLYVLHISIVGLHLKFIYCCVCARGLETYDWCARRAISNSAVFLNKKTAIITPLKKIDIWGSHGDNHDYYCLPGGDALQSVTILHPEDAGSVLLRNVNIFLIHYLTRFHIPGDSNKEVKRLGIVRSSKKLFQNNRFWPFRVGLNTVSCSRGNSTSSSRLKRTLPDMGTVQRRARFRCSTKWQRYSPQSASFFFAFLLLTVPIYRMRRINVVLSTYCFSVLFYTVLFIIVS